MNDTILKTIIIIGFVGLIYSMFNMWGEVKKLREQYPTGAECLVLDNRVVVNYVIAGRFVGVVFENGREVEVRPELLELCIHKGELI